MRRGRRASILALGLGLALLGASSALAAPPPNDEVAQAQGAPPPNPHGAASSPHGAGGPSRAAELFDAPSNVAEDEPSLPAGSLVVQLRDARGLPVVGAPLDLLIVRSSVMRGDQQSEKASRSDDRGEARFDGLERGAQLRYTVRSKHKGGSFGLPPVALGTEVGKRVTLHIYETTLSLEQALVGLQGLTYLSLKEGVIQVEQSWSVFNVGAVAWLPNDLLVPLPEGYKAFKQDDAEGELTMEQVPGKGVRLRGTAAPGRNDLSFRYQLDLDDEERQTLRIPNPPRMAQQQVVAEASTRMGLEVQGFGPAQRTQAQDGRRMLVTQKQAARMDGGLREAVITLSGLPTPSPARWVAAGIAAALVLGALAQRRARAKGELIDPAEQAERLRELRQAQASLLDEVVALEKAKREGSVGPKTYERVRRALVDALARIETSLGPSSGS
jgi:hypothetical protein